MTTVTNEKRIREIHKWGHVDCDTCDLLAEITSLRIKVTLLEERHTLFEEYTQMATEVIAAADALRTSGPHPHSTSYAQRAAENRYDVMRAALALAEDAV
jgi:hypothetical protein